MAPVKKTQNRRSHRLGAAVSHGVYVDVHWYAKAVDLDVSKLLDVFSIRALAARAVEYRARLTEAQGRSADAVKLLRMKEAAELAQLRAAA